MTKIYAIRSRLLLDIVNITWIGNLCRYNSGVQLEGDKSREGGGGGAKGDATGRVREGGTPPRPARGHGGVL